MVKVRNPEVQFWTHHLRRAERHLVHREQQARDVEIETGCWPRFHLLYPSLQTVCHWEHNGRKP